MGRKTSHISSIFIVLLFAFFACKNEVVEEKVPVVKGPTIAADDLQEIIFRQKLVVLTENSANSYFLYRGAQMGLEYEIIKEFAKHLGVALEMVLVKDLDEIIDMLNDGEGDLIACNLTVTKERAKKIDFSEPIMKTSQVLVQRKPDDWKQRPKHSWKKEVITDPEQLIGKTVHVWKNSSYYNRLLNLQEELGDTIYIEKLEGDVIPEEVIGMVSKGSINYTVTDKNVALINRKFFPNIDVDLSLSFKQRIAFGIRKTSPNLKQALNDWLKIFKKTSTYRFIKHKYLTMYGFSAKSRNEYSSIGGRKISPYDEHIQSVAQKYNWDWRLVAALIYKESKFKEDVESWAGAYGLMQFMPHVGPIYGVYPDSPPEVQIEGGIKKLHSNYMDWPLVEDSIQRLKFALATYNAGLGHVQDAQRLAEKYGANPFVWDNEVEKYILRLSKPKYYQDEVVKFGYLRGIETYSYVREIFIRYNEYSRSFPE